MRALLVMDPTQYVIRLWCAACMAYTRPYDKRVCDNGHQKEHR